MARPLESTQGRTGPLAAAVREIRAHPLGVVRVLNAGLSRVQARVRSVYAPAMPTSLAIEVTNRCSGSCVLCPVGQGRRSRPAGNLDWDRFRRLVDEAAPYVTFIGLYNWGEPFCHSRLLDMIRYVKACGIHVRISSNLHSFRPEWAEELVRSGLDGMGIAIHGLSEETYRNYQPRHRLADVLDKLAAILDARQRLGSRTPEVRLDFIVRRDNEHEAALLPAFAAERGVGYLLEEVSLNLRFLPFDRDMTPRAVTEEQLRRERLDLLDRWLPRDEGRVNPVYRRVRELAGAMPGPRERLLACGFPWRHMIVCWDGEVNLCCGSFRKEDSVGNAFIQGLRGVWNGAGYQAARRALRGERPARHVLCCDCPGMLM